MLLFIFYIILVCAKLVYSYELNIPNCQNCKWFMEGKNKDLGLCMMFKDKIIRNNKEKTVYNFAIHCRNNEDMCGKSGIFYENNEDKNYIKSFSKDEFKYYSYYMNNIAKKNMKKIR